eukprot:9003764-Pyramimonas_sp.AAC.2
MDSSSGMNREVSTPRLSSFAPMHLCRRRSARTLAGGKQREAENIGGNWMEEKGSRGKQRESEGIGGKQREAEGSGRHAYVTLYGGSVLFCTRQRIVLYSILFTRLSAVILRFASGVLRAPSPLLAQENSLAMYLQVGHVVEKVHLLVRVQQALQLGEQKGQRAGHGAHELQILPAHDGVWVGERRLHLREQQPPHQRRQPSPAALPGALPGVLSPPLEGGRGRGEKAVEGVRGGVADGHIGGG